MALGFGQKQLTLYFFTYLCGKKQNKNFEKRHPVIFFNQLFLFCVSVCCHRNPLSVKSPIADSDHGETDKDGSDAQNEHDDQEDRVLLFCIDRYGRGLPARCSGFCNRIGGGRKKGQSWVRHVSLKARFVTQFTNAFTTILQYVFEVFEPTKLVLKCKEEK